MNFKQLETFLWIVRLGSFAAAAARLKTSQAAVSIRIQEFEQALGVKLFDRRSRTPKLTAKGREMVPLADQVVASVDAIHTQIGDPESTSGVVRIGVADVIAMTWLEDFVAAARQAFPKIRLNLKVALAIDLIDDLRRGQSDIMLAPGEMWSKEFRTVLLGKAEFVWMASPSLKLPNRPLTPRALQDWPIISLSERSYHHRIVNQWFKDNQAICREFVVCNSIAAIVALTRRGLGIGLIPVAGARDELASGDLRIVECRPQIPPLDFHALLPDGESVIARRIAALAEKVSGFR